jgi:hypothetical protein
MIDEDGHHRLLSTIYDLAALAPTDWPIGYGLTGGRPSKNWANSGGPL